MGTTTGPAGTAAPTADGIPAPVAGAGATPEGARGMAAAAPDHTRLIGAAGTAPVAGPGESRPELCSEPSGGLQEFPGMACSPCNGTMCCCGLQEGASGGRDIDRAGWGMRWQLYTLGSSSLLCPSRNRSSPGRRPLTLWMGLWWTTALPAVICSCGIGNLNAMLLPHFQGMCGGGGRLACTVA